MSIDILGTLKRAADVVSTDRLMKLLHLQWSNDRRFTTPAFQKAASAIEAQLAEWQLKSERLDLPADGKAVCGDWKMPLGWDCTFARAEVITPEKHAGQVLADQSHHPAQVIMWSGPTPKEGLVADVVRVASIADLTKLLAAQPDALRGKLVYTPSHPQYMKTSLAAAGAVGVLSGYCRNRDLLPDACFWVNAWSDDPDGWAFNAGDTPLPGMSLTGRASAQLDRWLNDGPVTVRLTIHSRYFETTLPIVSAVVPGQDAAEIYTIGHAMEQGANDNASGCAVILESLRAIQLMQQQSGSLKRTVRGVLTNECYGTMGFAARQPDLMKRMLFGINWDTVGRHGAGTDAFFKHARCPDAAACVADTLMALLLQAWLPRALPNAPAKEVPYVLTDNAWSDPAIGAHCVYVDSQDRFWHTSADMPETIDPQTLHAFAVISTSFLQILANAGTSEAVWLAAITVSRYARRIEDAAGACAAKEEVNADLSRIADQIDYLRDVGIAAAQTALLLVPDAEKSAAAVTIDAHAQHLTQIAALQRARLMKLAGAARIDAYIQNDAETFADVAARKPRKTFIGTPTYQSIPAAARNGVGGQVWDGALHCALFWADGTVTFAEIVRRNSHEHGKISGAALAAHFRLMAENGLIEWK